jgi:hypothetical protein
MMFRLDKRTRDRLQKLAEIVARGDGGIIDILHVL